MTGIPDPVQIYERATSEGERRLGMPPLEKMSSGFIAGITIVFGVVALGMAEADVAPAFGGGPAALAGALAFGTGLVFVVVGRTELFSENFFDPVASAISARRARRWLALLQLWVLVLIFNLLGGAVMAAVFIVPGALPEGAPEALVSVAEDVAAKSGWATLARGVAAGTLITLLSYLLNATRTVGTRAMLAYIVGVFLALGPFDHVVVSALHLQIGLWFGGDVDYGDIVSNIAIAGSGNVLGGVLLMTLTHLAQKIGATRGG
ncbi:formate/nitrite transporter family protein [Microbacterium sp. LRZ72]|uniref:formate/nitrite transporter family protein n=1 Tax=Microbacterium sp. LRZ72 TaxID=2942481 RepID=UPI0029BE4DDF|nr:formate/nitrite transporter family protein [Microbacterium sp. LRZ72]MDX2375512.1 formate/nitrite transporter family protein [Microbacterium sp. LRZ72]